MSDQFVEKAKDNMGTIERLLKGLPIIRGYVDKELRREADYRLRQTIAGALESEKQRMYDLQKKLLKGGGLLYMDDLDNAVTRLQKLADRVKTASYGFAGLLDAVKIQEDQLNALHRFDVGLAARTYEVQQAVFEAIVGSLSLDEQQLIHHYRAADANGKTAIAATAASMASLVTLKTKLHFGQGRGRRSARSCSRLRRSGLSPFPSSSSDGSGSVGTPLRRQLPAWSMMMQSVLPGAGRRPRPIIW